MNATLFEAVVVGLLVSIAGLLASIYCVLLRIANAIEEDSGLPVPEAVAETKQKPTGPAPKVGFGRREQ